MEMNTPILALAALSFLIPTLACWLSTRGRVMGAYAARENRFKAGVKIS